MTTTYETDEYYIQHHEKLPLTTRMEVPVQELCEWFQPEDPEELKGNVYKYKARGDRYVIAEGGKKYFDIETQTTEVIDQSGVITEYTDILQVINRLPHFDFILVDRYAPYRYSLYERSKVEDDTPSPDDPADKELTFNSLRESHPEAAQFFIDELYSKERFSLITASDLNKRPVSDAIYPIIAELERCIAEEIKEEYPHSNELSKVVGRRAAEAWEGIEKSASGTHISEFLNLIDMKNLVSDSERLSERCGFRLDEEFPEDAEELAPEDFLKVDVDFAFQEINELRKRVMHANRPLVRNYEEVLDLRYRTHLCMSLVDHLSDDMSVKHLE
jgi:hypothetical protein